MLQAEQASITLARKTLPQQWEFWGQPASPPEGLPYPSTPQGDCGCCRTLFFIPGLLAPRLPWEKTRGFQTLEVYVKIDSTPLSLAAVSQPKSELEATDCNYSVSIDGKPENSTMGSKSSVWGIFGTTFITIFLAELGDKTQLSTLLMSAESQSPRVVFVGAAAALITTSFLGVALGSWIASRLSPKTVNKAAGVMLLFICVMLVWDVIQG